jgi:hypothetical protein
MAGEAALIAHGSTVAHEGTVDIARTPTPRWAAAPWWKSAETPRRTSMLVVFNEVSLLLHHLVFHLGVIHRTHWAKEAPNSMSTYGMADHSPQRKHVKELGRRARTQNLSL